MQQGTPQQGSVKSYTPGKFGFIVTPDGDDAMFNAADCFGPIAAGDLVEYILQPGPKKRACSVRSVGGNGVRETGTVKSYNPEKYGFITTIAGDQAMFRREDILMGQLIQAGDAVEFEPKVTPKGKQAHSVGKVGFVPGLGPPPTQTPRYLPPAPVQQAPHMGVYGMQAPMYPQYAQQIPNLASILPAVPGTGKTSSTSAVSLQTLETLPGRQYGTVKSFGASYGFIATASGEEALVNAANLMPGTTGLTAGDTVEFSLQITTRGKRAVDVTLAQKGPGVAAAPAAAAHQSQGGQREYGTVKSYNALKGFGFVFTSSGEEAMVGKTNIVGADSLQPQDVVEFEVITTDKGKRAVNVTKPNRYKPY